MFNLYLNSSVTTCTYFVRFSKANLVHQKFPSWSLKLSSNLQKCLRSWKGNDTWKGAMQLAAKMIRRQPTRDEKMLIKMLWFILLMITITSFKMTLMMRWRAAEVFTQKLADASLTFIFPCFIWSGRRHCLIISFSVTWSATGSSILWLSSENIYKLSAAPVWLVLNCVNYQEREGQWYL